MRFMNEYEVGASRRRYQAHPVLGPATATLENLMVWTNSHSDGWAYWPKPTRAAEKLMALIEGDHHPEGTFGARRDVERKDATVELLKAALRPVKAFRTRHGGDFEIVEMPAPTVDHYSEGHDWEACADCVEQAKRDGIVTERTFEVTVRQRLLDEGTPSVEESDLELWIRAGYESESTSEIADVTVKQIG